jgi:hypothetical protein
LGSSVIKTAEVHTGKLGRHLTMFLGDRWARWGRFGFELLSHQYRLGSSIIKSASRKSCRTTSVIELGVATITGRGNAVVESFA